MLNYILEKTLNDSLIRVTIIYTDYTPNITLTWVATGPACPVHTLKAFDIQHMQKRSTCVACHT